MKILITGFEPFGGETKNPSYEAVKLLPHTISDAEIIRTRIPVTFSGAFLATKEAILTHQPDVVINVGQAGGRPSISLERVAINLADARIPDNEGFQPEDEILETDGKNAYFTTLPVKAMLAHMTAHNIPASLSYSAGSYVCNAVMYRVLHLAETAFPHMKAGFIHVPYLPEQTVHKNTPLPSMDLPDITEGLRLAIEGLLHA